MDSLQFEWDDSKAKVNLKKHGVDFDEVATIFCDPYYLEDYDEAHSDQEDRFKIIGMSRDGRVLIAIYIEREGRIRIISSRAATKQEQEIYESQI
ncbi:BrnT family toxin [Thermosynechococcaceae cyanobacterium BACA0444]|uniref:BrnT family toxin n=1 Tax=Pseudocalidococcus azoricus BACA0444 TaxID=2918990 RepID=A0AAE4FVY5_9CYAN|nr:BrnT family toxin [Pseudocalidococcus azoricus]MDS3862277.1 BrnT family toxin [Pseudocalidococcus azoricus BACA0444]